MLRSEKCKYLKYTAEKEIQTLSNQVEQAGNLKEVNFVNKFNVYGRCRTVRMVNMVEEIKGVWGVYKGFVNLSELKIFR